MRYAILLALLPACFGGPFIDASRASKALPHGEMYVDGGGAITISTANVPHPIATLITGHVDNGVTFSAGGSGAITAFADAGGGEITVTDATHGLSTGDRIFIVGTTNYNQSFTITKVDADNFKITDTWVANEAPATWFQGSRLVVPITGDYNLTSNFSVTKAAGASQTLTTQVYVNGTAQAQCKTVRELASTDTGAFGVSCWLADCSAGDEILAALNPDNTDNLTVNNANLVIEGVH